MKIWIILTCLCTMSYSFFGDQEVVKMEQEHLYKILSFENWQKTQSKETVFLSPEDDLFIHFSTEDQVEKIVTKYWTGIQQFVILKIDRSKLEGRLVFETNAGGATKYFHLYDGFIPVNSILEAEIVSLSCF